MKMAKSVIETAKALREMIGSYCASNGLAPKEYYSRQYFSPAQECSPWKERERISRILQFLGEETNGQRFRQAIESSEEEGISGGVTWQHEHLLNGDEFVAEAFVFHNETAMNHFSGCMFGTQSQTSPFYDFMNDQGYLSCDGRRISTPYFQGLQAEASRIIDAATKIRREIVRTERIFRCHVYQRRLHVYDPNWNLRTDELVFPEAEESRPRRSAEELERWASKKVVPLEIYQLNNGNRLMLHDLIADDLVRAGFPDCTLDEQKWLRDDPMRLLREVTYMAKERRRVAEIRILGERMIGAYNKVIEILDAIREL